MFMCLFSSISRHTICALVTGVLTCALPSYAARGYTPTTGPILVLHPPEGDGVRWDSGVLQGGEVTSAFDPMIAKLIIRGADRNDAIVKADKAFKETVLLGCKTKDRKSTRLNSSH